MKTHPAPNSATRACREWHSCTLGLMLLGVSGAAPAIMLDPLPATGAGGAVNGHTFTIGADAVVEELDAFINIPGEDLNGGVFGTAAQFAFDPLPAGLDLSISQQLFAGDVDLRIRYSFTNNTGGDLLAVDFLSVLDVDIAAAVNTTSNEYVTETGIPGSGEDFEVDTAAGLFPEIFDHLLLGDLDAQNAYPGPGTTGDVVMALSIHLGDLLDGDTVSVDILISEAGSTLGGFALTQHDAPSAAGSSNTQVTYSAALVPPPSAVPLPAPLMLFAIGAFGLIASTFTSTRGR